MEKSRGKKNLVLLSLYLSTLVRGDGIHDAETGDPFPNQRRYTVSGSVRSRILEVVIMRRLVTWVQGIWRGEGLGKG